MYKTIPAERKTRKCSVSAEARSAAGRKGAQSAEWVKWSVGGTSPRVEPVPSSFTSQRERSERAPSSHSHSHFNIREQASSTFLANHCEVINKCLGYNVVLSNNEILVYNRLTTFVLLVVLRLVLLIFWIIFDFELVGLRFNWLKNWWTVGNILSSIVRFYNHYEMWAQKNYRVIINNLIDFKLS